MFSINPLFRVAGNSGPDVKPTDHASIIGATFNGVAVTNEDKNQIEEEFIGPFVSL